MPPLCAAAPTLVLFCRRPAEGVGKQRLASALGTGPAAELAALLLETALEDAASWPGPVVLSPADPQDTAWASGLLTRTSEVVAQPAGNLGERLNAVDRALRARGHQQLCFIGSDAPALDPAYYSAARAALAEADVVLGPAVDGGVTLMAAAQPWPSLSGLPWSSADLGHALSALCEARGLRVAALGLRHDVDVPADLATAWRELRTDRRPGRRALRAWLGARAQVLGLEDEDESFASD